jgi:group II intron reverse transcriptase/maturase
MVFNNLGHLINFEMLKELLQRLNGSKAVGVDRVTKAKYMESCDENLRSLITRIRKGTYKPKPARFTEIPKDDGGKRPLAVSCLEDKLIQLAVSEILSRVFEPLFLPTSYGFRPGLNCHDSLRALQKSAFKNWRGAIIEIDIKKCFNTIPHKPLMAMLREKISDERFIKLIERLIQMPIQAGKTITQNKVGCPQGSILSPILSNIYLHYVIDDWLEEIRQTHLKGRVELIRYADDMVFTFQYPKEASRFYRVLPKRLGKYGLTMHEAKSQMLMGGHIHAQNADKYGKRLPTFKFLGFTCYWGKSRKGYWRLKLSSRKDRFAAKLKGLRGFIWKRLHWDIKEIIRVVKRVLTGWLNYHAVSDNGRRVQLFIHLSKRILFKWCNRRGGRRRMNWEKFTRILKQHQYPESWKLTSMF